MKRINFWVLYLGSIGSANMAFYFQTGNVLNLIAGAGCLGVMCRELFKGDQNESKD